MILPPNLANSQFRGVPYTKHGEIYAWFTLPVDQKVRNIIQTEVSYEGFITRIYFVWIVSESTSHEEILVYGERKNGERVQLVLSEIYEVLIKGLSLFDRFRGFVHVNGSIESKDTVFYDFNNWLHTYSDPSEIPTDIRQIIHLDGDRIYGSVIFHNKHSLFDITVLFAKDISKPQKLKAYVAYRNKTGTIIPQEVFDPALLVYQAHSFIRYSTDQRLPHISQFPGGMSIQVIDPR